MLPPEVLEAAKIIENPQAPEKERDKAAHLYHGYIAKQAPTTEILEHLSPQIDRDRLPIQVGRRYFHSWKDTEKLYREVTEWKHFSLDQCPAVTAPPDTQAAFEDVFADLIRERGAVLKLHPLYRRWTVFLKEPTADQGFQYLASIMIVESNGKCGQIPADLERDLDPRLHPVIRSLGVGGYKVPTRQDFEHLRWQWADRSRETSRQKAMRMMKEQIRLEDAETAEKMAFIDDFVSHNAALLSRDINRKYGSMQGLPFVPQTSLEEFDRQHPLYEEEYARDPNTGATLTYKVRRRLKPFERGDFFSPLQKRAMALTAYGDYWLAAMKRAEAQIESTNADIRGEGRITKMRLEFLDPAHTDAELTAMVAAANEGMPGMVEALFGERGPRGILDNEVAEAAARIEDAIKLQAWQESNKWRAENHLPLRPCPVERHQVTKVEDIQLNLLHDEAAPIPAEREARMKEAAWQSRALQQLPSRS